MLVPFRNKIPDNGGKLPIWEASKTFSLPPVCRDQKGGNEEYFTPPKPFSIQQAKQKIGAL